MLRENGFDAVLTKVSTKSKTDIDKVVIEFTIRHVSEYEKQHFLESLEKATGEHLQHLFTYPVLWKSINIDQNHIFNLDFDELDKIRCILKSIKAKHVIPTKTNQTESFVYDLTFEKEIESGDEDWIFATYLNRREEDENGRFHLIKYHCFMEYIPPLQQDLFDKDE